MYLGRASGLEGSILEACYKLGGGGTHRHGLAPRDGPIALAVAKLVGVLLRKINLDRVKLSVSFLFFRHIRQRIVVARIVQHFVERWHQIVCALDHESARDIGKPFQLVTAGKVSYLLDFVELGLASMLPHVGARSARGIHLRRNGVSGPAARSVRIDFDSLGIDYIDRNVGKVGRVGDCVHFLFDIVGIQKAFRKQHNVLASGHIAVRKANRAQSRKYCTRLKHVRHC